MKKKIHPDGTVEYEGTPEELKELEESSDKQNESQKKKRRVLTEEQALDVADIVKEAMKKHVSSKHGWPWEPTRIKINKSKYWKWDRPCPQPYFKGDRFYSPYEYELTWSDNSFPSTIKRGN